MTRSDSHVPHVAIACGGTGGHLFPGLAVAQKLLERGACVSLLVSPKEVDQQAVKSLRNLEVVTLPVVALQSGSRLAFLRGFVQSWFAMRRRFRTSPPFAVLSMGGFTGAVPVLVGKRAGVHTFLHESNAVPGRANRWLARLVDQAFIGFPQAAARMHSREITVTGTPVRAEFCPRNAAACRAALGFDPLRPVIAILGGSQGASGLNQRIVAALPELAKRFKNLQWLHLAGVRDEESVRAVYAALKMSAKVHAFLSQMDQVLAAATMAVSRAGASTLAELAALRVPAVLVPFPHAVDDHQRHNALAFADTGAGYLLDQGEVTADRLGSFLEAVLESPATCEKVQAALGLWHAPQAADQIAESILSAFAKPQTSHMPVDQQVRPPGCDIVRDETRTNLDRPGSLSFAGVAAQRPPDSLLPSTMNNRRPDTSGRLAATEDVQTQSAPRSPLTESRGAPSAKQSAIA